MLFRHLPLCLTFIILVSGNASLRSQTLVVVEEGLGKVVEVDARNPTCRAEIPIGLKPHEIALSPDGRTAYVSNFGLLEANFKVGVPGKTISVIDVSSAKEVSQLTLPAGPLAAPHGVKIRPNPKGMPTELFTNAEIGDTMLVFDTASRKVLRTFPLPAGVHNFIFSANGATLYAFSILGLVFRIDPSLGHVEASVQIPSPRGLAWTADRSGLIVAGKGEVEILDPQSLAAVKTFSGLDIHQLFYPTASLDVKLIFAPAVLDGIVLVLDAKTGQELRRIKTGSPLSVTLDPAKNRAYISNVHVMAEMDKLGAAPRPGGVDALDLASFNTTPLPGIVDANGVALSNESMQGCP